MQKNKAQIQYATGSITVFLSLILILILSLLLTLVEGTRVNAAKIASERTLSLAMDSMLAEYYGPLWEEYHIFGYYNGESVEANRRAQEEQLLKDYMSYNLDMEKDLPVKSDAKPADLYQFELNAVSIKEETRLMDYHGQLLMNEAVEYMKYKEVGNLTEQLLEKLKLFEKPEKINYLYEEKQKTEEQLIEIDKGILALMELLDGVKTSKMGIKVSKQGILQTTEYYVKKLCFNEITPQAVGINQDNVFQALKNSYINPESELNDMISNLSGLGSIGSQLSGIAANQQYCFNSLSDLRSSLDSINMKQKKSKADKEEIRNINGRINEILLEISNLYDEAQELEQERQNYLSIIEASKNDLLKVLSEIRPKIEEAMSITDTLIFKSKVAAPVIERFENTLNDNKDMLGEEIYKGFDDNLKQFKKYVNLKDHGYDFEKMKEVLQKDLEIVKNTIEYLRQGQDEINKGWYPAAEQSFRNASLILINYTIDNLTIDYSTLILDKTEHESPIGKIKELMQSGLTSLIIDPEVISDKELMSGILPSDIAAMSQESGNPLEKIEAFIKNIAANGDTFDISEVFQSFDSLKKIKNLAADGVNNLAQELLFQDYIKEHFEMFPVKSDSHKGKPSALTYEQEYLLIGKGSDKENITSVISNILVLRTITDFVSLLGDSAKLNEAKEVAAALVGFTGLPILIGITQVVLMLFWSLAEAILDVTALMMGKEVPIIKQKLVLEFSELFMINRSFLQQKASKLNNTDKLSLSYQDYLKIYLIMKKKEDLAYRSMDLMQENIKMRYNQKEFQIYNCLYGFETSADFIIAPKFINIPFVKKLLQIEPEGYHFYTELSHSY